MIVSKVTVVLLNGCILPTGGVASKGSAPAACAAGLYYVITQTMSLGKSLHMGGPSSFQMCADKSANTTSLYL